MSKFKTFEYNLLILEKHLDTFGHVNNAVYMQLYEEARWDFITGNGYGMNRIQQEKKGPIILEANIKYRREIKNRDQIKIVSHVQGPVSKIMGIHQEMINASGEVCSIADFKIAFFDLEQRKMIEPTSSWLQACGVESN